MRILFITLMLALFTACHPDNFSPPYAEYANGGPQEGEVEGDTYRETPENDFILTSQEATSTFSIDADGGSYANVRRMLTRDGVLPPAGAVRIEEMINYFDLDYGYAPGDHPLSLQGEVADCPWREDHALIRIGIEGRPVPERERGGSNFVFLIDVSGSMNGEDRLDLLKTGFKRFVDNMQPDDRVAVVTYAGQAGLLLDSTDGTEKERIKQAIDRLGAGGSTAGADGIVTAYEIAREHFVTGGNNRIIIGTDGDFNVGVSSYEGLIKLIEEMRDSGVYLTVLGVGRGNYNDAALEQIANKGNGTYEYIDNLAQLRKVFDYDREKFYTVAKDVKVQVTFNPAIIAGYRLIGYANRVLANEAFDDDEEDAGELGGNQNVTALYQVYYTEAGATNKTDAAFSVDFRYKDPAGGASRLLQLPVVNDRTAFAAATPAFRFVAGVAAFGMLLRQSEYAGEADYDQAASWVEDADLTDRHGFKAELLQLMRAAKQLER